MGLDIYFSSAERQKNIRTDGKIFETIDFGEICYLSKRFYPVMDYFRKKYNYDADEYNHLLLEKKELETFLEVVEKGKIFEHSDFEEWFESYGTYYYHRIDENGNYIDDKYDREKDEWIELPPKTKEDIKQEFLEELKKDLGKLFYYLDDEDEVAFSYSA
mgnify:FL=1